MTRVAGDWLADLATQRVLSLLTKAGHRAYVVGGAVRNALAGRPVTDIDIATSARPDEVARLAEAAGIQVVPTGLDHGTLTLVAEGRPFEVTTFRRDVATDGRRAVVAFSDDLAEDAGRRDFTMNALYAAADGSIADPVGGLADLAARRVRFIGDAGERIREDYLRSLRYFRFLAQFGDPSEGPDPEALAAVAAHIDGLAGLSAERVGAETRKLLAAPDPAPATAAMAASGALAAVLPGADPRPLGPLVHLETAAGVAPDFLRRLAAIGGEEPGERLRLSRKEARRLAELRADLARGTDPAEVSYRRGPGPALDAALVAAALAGTGVPGNLRDRIDLGAAARFPVAAADLMPRLSGRDLGAALDRLERDWIASGFTLDREALLSRL